jgi:hypothetical protein
VYEEIMGKTDEVDEDKDQKGSKGKVEKERREKKQKGSEKRDNNGNYHSISKEKGIERRKKENVKTGKRETTDKSLQEKKEGKESK